VAQGDQVSIIALSASGSGVFAGEPSWLPSGNLNGSGPGLSAGEPAWPSSGNFVRGWRGPRNVGSAILSAAARGPFRACVFLFFLFLFAFGIRASFHENVGELQHDPP
jgi:hypothetical protein